MDPWYRLVNGVGRGALRALGVDIRWSGTEHLPTSGPVLLAANHVSFPDFVFLERVAITRRRYVRFLCRDDIWLAPPGRGWVGTWMDRMGHVPVDRAAGAAAYLHARRLLRAGEAVGIFPEAGVSRSYAVRWMMPGAAALARETGTPIVPAAIWGSQRIFTVGQDRPDLTRGRRVDVALGPPMQVAPGADAVDTTRELGERLTDLLEGLQALPVHQPRPGEIAPWHPAHLGGHAFAREAATATEEVPRGAVRPTWGPAECP